MPDRILPNILPKCCIRGSGFLPDRADRIASLGDAAKIGGLKDCIIPIHRRYAGDGGCKTGWPK
jgi:hypothetical protein